MPLSSSAAVPVIALNVLTNGEFGKIIVAVGLPMSYTKVDEFEATIKLFSVFFGLELSVARVASV